MATHSHFLARLTIGKILSMPDVQTLCGVCTSYNKETMIITSVILFIKTRSILPCQCKCSGICYPLAVNYVCLTTSAAHDQPSDHDSHCSLFSQ